MLRPLASALRIGNVAAEMKTLAERLYAAAQESSSVDDDGVKQPWIRLWGGKLTPRVNEIARRIGHLGPSVSRLFEGDSGGERPSYEVIVALARLFGVSPKWLATGDGPKRELPADVLLGVLRDPPEELVKTIKRSRGTWTSSTLAEALHPETLAAKTKSRSDGTPDGGWAALLDDIQTGVTRQVDAEAVTDMVDKTAGKRRRL